MRPSDHLPATTGVASMTASRSCRPWVAVCCACSLATHTMAFVSTAYRLAASSRLQPAHSRIRHKQLDMSMELKGPNPFPVSNQLTYDQKPGKFVRFAALKAGEAEVIEGLRSLKEYMALPPSQYSVLDADSIVRVSDDCFRCQINGVNFFGYRFVPVLYVQVHVDTIKGTATLNIFKIELTGSRAASMANGSFDVKARNVVAYRSTPVASRKVMTSTVTVDVNAGLPRFNLIPPPLLEKGGSVVIQGILNVMVPRFVKILAKDYQNWSRGDDSRKAVAEKSDRLSQAELDQIGAGL